MHFKSIPIALSALLGMVAVATADSFGYVLPQSGDASTTQFYLNDYFSNGTACGVDALPNGKKSNGTRGGGPGYLYASINQLAFGANPFVTGGGGPGGACGICYNLTPRDSSGTLLNDNSLTFKIVDECSAGISSGTGPCSQCSTSDVNTYGRTWHFSIATDAMSEDQYQQFYHHSQGDLNWSDVEFVQTTCGVDNPNPGTKSWGCVSNCSNNDKASVCAKSPAAATTGPEVVTITVGGPTPTHSKTTSGVLTVTVTLPPVTTTSHSSTSYVTLTVTV